MKLSIFNSMKKNIQPEETGTTPPEGATTPETGTTPPEDIFAIGYDPKNRAVLVFQFGTDFKVTKPDTGFDFTGTEAEYKEVFEHQVSCSQN